MEFRKILLASVLLAVFVSVALCQKSGKNQAEKLKKGAQETVHHAPSTGNKVPEYRNVEQAQVVPEQVQGFYQVRQCRCDELDQCVKQETDHFTDLTSRCRHQCGLTFLTNETAEIVANCYDAFEKSKREQKTNKNRCVENLLSKPCLTDNQQSPPSQATLTVDPSKIVQHRTKRNFKNFLPPNINLYASCVKTCRKNGGIVHFNADGTPAKPAATKANGNGNVNAQTNEATRINTVQKPGKGYAGCAQKLGCQLLPVDKQLEKQAKQICKYHPDHPEDNQLTLCTCLEGALKQNFQCQVPQSIEIGTNTCSSSSGQSGEKSGCQQDQRMYAK